MQLLQNGKQQFIDQNGAPLANGSVYFYAPSTTNPVPTYQDPAGSILNTNPVALDSRGQAIIWGSGTYRQIVKDAAGVTIWDQIVSEAGSQINALTQNLASTATGQGDSLIGVLQPATNAVARTQHDKNAETVSVKDFGATGDGSTDDTAALQKAFDSGKDLFIPDGTYLVSSYLQVKTYGQQILGSGELSKIKFVPSTYIQPAIVVTQAAVNAKLRHFAVDHQGGSWPSGAAFLPGFLNGGGGDARGVAVLVMADGAIVDGVYCYGGWDNGLAFGNFSLTTGAQSAGPDHVKVSNCHTYNNGSGKHAWGPAPNGYYFQGCGVDMLTATNFEVSNCTDYGSYGGFWCDTNGGGFGHFSNCVAVATAKPAIWSDAASGSNQPWYVGSFGGNITGAGAGWKKTPGGVSFYSGSYGVHFNNCTAYNPGMIGFAFDQYSSGNTATNIRVVGSQCAGIVDAGIRNSFSEVTLEGCCLATGQTSPSGSVCPTFAPFEAVGNSAAFVVPQISNLVIKGSQVYPPSTSFVAYPYAIYARTDATGAYVSKISVFGAEITAGSSGTAKADTGCSAGVITGSGALFEFDSYGANVAFNFANGGGLPFQITKDAPGNCTLTNYDPAKNITLNQAGAGAVLLGSNGVTRASFGNNTQFFALPTSATGLPSGSIWNNAGVLNIAP